MLVRSQNLLKGESTGTKPFELVDGKDFVSCKDFQAVDIVSMADRCRLYETDYGPEIVNPSTVGRTDPRHEIIVARMAIMSHHAVQLFLCIYIYIYIYIFMYI